MKDTPLKVPLIAFACTCFLLLELGLIQFVDQPVALWSNGLKITHTWLFDIFRTITAFGDSAWYLWPCGLLALVAAFVSRGKDVPSRYRRLFGFVGVRAFFLFACVGLSGLVVNILKFAIGRPRPVEWFRSGAYDFSPFTAHWVWSSMPSGHSTTAFALCCALGVLMPRAKLFWLFLAAVICLSRIMVNAHYLSDTLAGALIGYITVVLFSNYGMFRLSKVIFPIDSQANKG